MLPANAGLKLLSPGRVLLIEKDFYLLRLRVYMTQIISAYLKGLSKYRMAFFF